MASAPSVFQGFMSEVIQEYLHRFVLVYINDIHCIFLYIIVYNETDHCHHVSLVLAKLREYRLDLKAEKCILH